MDKRNDFNISFNEDGLRLDDEDIKISPHSERSSDKTDSSFSRQAPSEEQAKADMAKMIARKMAASDDINFSSPDQALGTAQKTAQREDTPAAVKKQKKPAAKANDSKKSGKKKKKKKKSHAGRNTAIALSVFVVLLLAAGGGIYLTGLNAYKGVFLDNTFINGVNVSGKTQAEALTLVKEQSLIPETVTVTRKDSSDITIKLEDIGYEDNTKELISDYYSQQDHYRWLSSKFNDTEFSFTSSFEYDKDLLEQLLKRKIVDADMATRPQDAYITRQTDNSEYTVVSEVEGDKVDSAKAQVLYDYVEENLDEMIFDINVSRLDCYETASVTAEDLYEACEKLNNIYYLEITFDFTYTTQTLTGETIEDWIEFDTDNPADGYTVDEDKVMAYVEELADKYDTYGKDREFQTTNRGVITIEEGAGCYGWWIDQEETKNLICDLIIEGESTETEPIYYVNPYSQYSYTCNPEWRTAEKDYGDTYFEVDLSAQHMWYYENGELKMETDIVSGYPSESRNTPAGVYKLWLKQRGKTLTGSSDGKSYSSYVEYWNNISTISIGFHDASWQNGVFGGEKYKSSTWGSHGCINMPLDKAKYIYENCAEGTPVFAYWS